MVSPMTAADGRIAERAKQRHELKCWPEFFGQIASGAKTHELRRCDDRDFAVGDELFLREFDPKEQTYTGNSVIVVITYITSAESICAFSPQALDKRFCIMSIAPTTQAASEEVERDCLVLKRLACDIEDSRSYRTQVFLAFCSTMAANQADAVLRLIARATLSTMPPAMTKEAETVLTEAKKLRDFYYTATSGHSMDAAYDLAVAVDALDRATERRG